MKTLGLTVLVMAASVVGCGSGSTTPSAPADIGGTWDYAGTISNNPVQVSCNFTGTITINQAGDQATGTYNVNESCNGPGGTVQQSGSGNVGGGEISGSHVSFKDDGGCTYSGQASGDPTNNMSGSVSCVIGIQGTNYTFAGTWNASR
jgi:hypothetical protein